MSSAEIPWIPAVLIVWAVIGALIEGYGIGTPELGDTMSEGYWWLRSTVMVWVVVPLTTWTFFHFTMPFEPDSSVMNDVFYLSVGVGLAAWNAAYRAKTQRRAKQEPPD